MGTLIDAAVAQLTPIIENSIKNSTINATYYMEKAFSSMLQDTLDQVNTRITSIEQGYEDSLQVIGLMIIIFGSIQVILVIGVLWMVNRKIK
jgi:hypothetical protein